MGGFTCFNIGVTPRSRGVRGNVWSRLYLSNFEVLYVDITFTKECGHLSLGEHAPYLTVYAHKKGCSTILLYHLFIKRRLKIIQVVVGAIFRKKKIP